MKFSNYLLLVSVSLLFCAQSYGVEPRIKLSGPKSLVLRIDTRETALEVASQYLNEKDGAFAETVQGVDTPFAFEQPVDAVPLEEEAAPEVVVSYDEASVLQVVSANFANQVGGALSRGSTNFLQLKGGSMIKPGTSFPVTIPQAQGQVFTVTVTEITSGSYTLQLGDAVQTITIDGSAPGDSGATRVE